MAQEKYKIKITKYIGNIIGLRSDYSMSEFADEDGFLKDNMLAFVLKEEDGYKAYIIYSESEGEGEIIATVAPYNYNEHIRELLDAVRINARCNGTSSIKITVNATREKNLVELLTLGGYKKEDNDYIEYVLDASKLLYKEKTLTKNLKNIVPFYKVPVDVMVSFDEENLDKLTEAQNYKNVVDINPELSIAYVEEGKMLGYLICRVNEKDILLVAGYTRDDKSETLKSVLSAFRLLRQKLYPGIDVIRVRRYSDNVEKFVRTYLEKKNMYELHVEDYRLVL